VRVVLLHGLAGSRRAFDRLQPLLAAHEVVALDLPGHGDDAAGAGAESIEEMAGAVRDVVSEPAVLLGHSMGGLVATAVAEQDPALVERLVLVNTPPTWGSRLTARGGTERALRVPLLGPLVWHAAPASRTRDGLRSAFAPGVAVPDVFVEDARKLSWTTFVRATSSVDLYVEERTLAERVAALDVPVTVVFGTQDQRVAPASLRDYGEDVEVVRIPEAGHSPIWETPDRVAAVLGG
jgi:pimeloyl-ACP methyl ester carboxylesterase